MTAIWLANMAFGVLGHVWPVTLALVAFLAVATTTDCWKHRLRLKGLRVFIPAVVAIALILIAGAVFHEMPKFRVLPYIGAAVCAILSLIAIWRTPGMRLTASALALLLIAYAFCCSLVADMAITGNWL